MASQIRPEDIENPSFSTSALGYKREEVDTFLRDVAQAYEQLLRESTAAKMKADRVFESVGQEAGILMQNARDAAVELRLKSETEAKKIRDDARRSADRAKVQVDQLKREAQEVAEQIQEEASKDAERIRIEAKSEAERAREEADRLRRDAQEVAEQIQEEASKDAERIRNEAKSEADRSREETDRLRREAEEEIARQRRQAEEEAAEIKNQAVRFQQAAQADATVFYDDAHQSATQLKREAENRAADLRASVEREVSERIEQAEARVRALQEMEIALRKRLQAFELKMAVLAESEQPEIATSPRPLPAGEERPRAVP